MTDLNFLSSCDKLRKEDLSTRRVYKPRRCKAELSTNAYNLGKRRNDELRNDLQNADMIRREVNTAMLYRWFKQNMKDVLRT